MPDQTTALRRVIRAVGAVSPNAAARLAAPLFRYSRPTRPVHARERDVHEQAVRSVLRLDGRRIAVFEWGEGDRLALLVHGWRGRTAQFAPIVRELRGAGFRVIGFDAPGNGDSSGRRNDVAQVRAVLHALQRRHGEADLVVAHSFGMLAVLAAVHDGFDARRIVSIAGVARFGTIVDGFAAQVGLSPAATAAFAGRLRRLRLQDVDDTAAFLEALDAERAPLPAGIPLTILHDRDDAVVPYAEAEALHRAHPGSILVPSTGLGHTRILGDDDALDAVLAAVGAPGAPAPRPAPVTGA